MPSTRVTQPITFADKSPLKEAPLLDANFKIFQEAINATNLQVFNASNAPSVLNYGADPTGATDSAPAFTSAGSGSSSIVEINVPAGTYLLNSNPAPTGNVTWIIHAGATFTGPGVLNQKKMQFGSTHGVIALQNNKTVNTVVGETPGLKVGICADTDGGWVNNPSAGDFVTLYPYITSSALRLRIWALNPIVDIPAGLPATAWCYEGNVNNAWANAPDPHSVNHQIGIDIVSGGSFAPSAAFTSLSTTLANRWKHGIWLESVGGQTNSTLIKAAGAGVTVVNVDFGIDLSLATINFQGLRVGNTPAAQVAGIAARQFANGGVGLFLQRFTDSAPTGNILQIVNAANSQVLSSFDAVGNLFTLATISSGSSLGVNGSAPPAQPTGYGTPTGNARTSSFTASTITLPNLAAEVAQMVIDLKAYGIFGA
jgi:hypothetical protein